MSILKLRSIGDVEVKLQPFLISKQIKVEYKWW
jgi:hypothetical protein